MWTIKKTFRNIGRVREIFSQVVYYGFGRFLDETNLSSVIGYGKKIVTLGKAKDIEKLPEEVRFRKLLESLGPTFVKVGQFLSTRGDIFPEKFTKELEKLQDEVLPFGYDEAVRQVESNLGKKLSSVFKEFSKEPVASASIAQVHKGILHDGTQVAVKIKRPGIETKIEHDLAILIFLAGVAEKYNQEAKNIQLLEVTQEFADQLNKELNFVLEANYMEKFRDYFSKNDNILIPQVIWEYTDMDVLTMEFVKGVPIDSIKELKEKDIDMIKLSETGVDFYLKQVFEFGFFHADPHPGNFLVTDKGETAILDFGIIGKVDRKLLEHLSAVFLGLINFDIESIIEEMVSFGLIDRDADLRKIQRDMMDVILPVYGQNIGNVDVVLLLNDIIDIGRKHYFKFPIDYLLIFKTFSFLESSGRKLNPDFNFLNFAEPYAKKILLKKYSPSYLFNDFREISSNYSDVLRRAPKDYKILVDKLKEDDLSINFIHRNLDVMSREMDRSANRLSFSIIIAAIVLSSSLFILADVGPKILDIPFLGLFGFVIASFLGLGLAIGIFKSGKL